MSSKNEPTENALPAMPLSDWSDEDKPASNGSGSNASGTLTNGNDLPTALNAQVEPRDKGHGGSTWAQPVAKSRDTEVSNGLSSEMVYDMPSVPSGVPVFSPLAKQGEMGIELGDKAGLDAEHPPNTWMEPDPNGHDGLYVKTLRKFVFPFMVRFDKLIVFAWIVIFALGCAFGLKFLNNTRSNLDVPKGMPSEVAIRAFEHNYPQASNWPPSFIVVKAKNGQNVVGPFTEQLSKDLKELAKHLKDTVSFVTGYWELAASSDTKLLADAAVSADSSAMISTVYFNKNATLNTINDVVDELFEFAHKHDNKDFSVGCTGMFPLFREMSEATTINMELIDATVLPIAIVILGLTLRSYRHMGVAVCNLGCSLLLSFAVMVPISDKADINPFAPSVMMSLGIAICFDYTLFMTTRFREERLNNFKSKEDAVFACIAFAGHVVILSGMTLFCTFIILVFFPQNFLQSVGYGCAVTVFCTIFCNVTLTPALLLSFDCLSFFDCKPRTESCCCKVPRTDPATAAHAKKMAKAAIKGERSLRPKPGIFYYIAYWVTRYPLLVILICAGVTAPFLYRFLQMNPTSDDRLIYLQDSGSLNTLTTMKASYSEGSLDPYHIIMATAKENGVFTQEYFDQESALIAELIKTQPKYMNTDSLLALSYFKGKPVSFTQAQSLMSSDADPMAGAYRVKVGSLLNTDKSTTRVMIETIVNPNSDLIADFVRSVRKILLERSKPSDKCKDPAVPGVCMYLFGGYTTTLDIQTALYSMVPIEIGATVAIVLVLIGINFGSIAIAFRLAVTVFTSLAWTYGFMVLVYQPGDAQNAFAVLTPSIKISSGIYWIIPIMSFSILVGLALDYDIFLMSRVVEFRLLGWSDAAAVALAVDKTAGIITSAGLIMAISFAGLLIPKTVVLNQYGFSLFIGVTFDTFLIRTILGPAVITAFGCGGKTEYLNWFPYKMPRVILKPAEEHRAILAGYLTPVYIPEGATDVEMVIGQPAEGGGGNAERGEEALLPEQIRIATTTPVTAFVAESQ